MYMECCQVFLIPCFLSAKVLVWYHQENMTGKSFSFFLYLIWRVCIQYNHIIVSRWVPETWIVHLCSPKFTTPSLTSAYLCVCACVWERVSVCTSVGLFERSTSFQFLAESCLYCTHIYLCPACQQITIVPWNWITQLMWIQPKAFVSTPLSLI